MSEDQEDDSELREEVRKLHALYVEKFVTESREHVDRTLADNATTDTSEWFSKERQRSIAFESWVITKLADLYSAMDLHTQAVASRRRSMELLVEAVKTNMASTSDLAKMFTELAGMVREVYAR